MTNHTDQVDANDSVEDTFGRHDDYTQEVADSFANRYDDEGFLLDESGNAYGHCNSCGEEAEAYSECCDDGEIEPYN